MSLLDLTAGKGSAESVGADLANEMARRGHEIYIHCDTDTDDPSSFRLEPAIQLIRQRLTAGRVRDLRKTIVNLDPDLYLIFYFDSRLSLQYAIAANTGIPIAAQECTDPNRAVKNLLASGEFDSAPEAFRLREAILSDMHGIRLALDSRLDSLHPITRLSAMAFPNAFAPAARRADPVKSTGRKTLLCVEDASSSDQNVTILVSAFAHVAKDFPDWDLRLVVQSGHFLIPPSEAVVDLRDRVGLCQRTEGVREEYERAQLHVICSPSDDLPTSVCEAMLHGLPSIGFADCAGVNEVIESGLTGLLVERRNAIDSLALGLSRLMGDADLRASMGEAAFRMSTAYVDEKGTYDRWEALFRRARSYKGNCHRLLAEQARIDGVKAGQCLRLRQSLLSMFDTTTASRTDQQGLVSTPRLMRNLSMPLVSVIVPLHNKAGYIRETLCSVIADSYPNKEIVVIDDASTDESVEIADEIAAECNYATVTRLERNVGLSGARNAGLALAKGEFIHFWDADDVYANGALAEVIKIMLLDDCDIATGVAHRQGSLLRHYSLGNNLWRRTNVLANPWAFATPSACFKIYSKAFLDRYRLTFVDRLYMQDLEFNFRAFVQAESISVTPYVLGDYRSVESSSSKSFNLARVHSAIQIDELTRSFLAAEKRPEFESLRQRQVMHFAFAFFIRRLIRWALERTRDYAEVTERFRARVSQYRDGVLELSLVQPQLALLLVAFGAGRDDICRELWAGGAGRRAKYIGELLNNPFDFSAMILNDFFDRAFVQAEAARKKSA